MRWVIRVNPFNNTNRSESPVTNERPGKRIDHSRFAIREPYLGMALSIRTVPGRIFIPPPRAVSARTL